MIILSHTSHICMQENIIQIVFFDVFRHLKKPPFWTVFVDSFIYQPLTLLTRPSRIDLFLSASCALSRSYSTICSAVIWSGRSHIALSACIIICLSTYVPPGATQPDNATAAPRDNSVLFFIKIFYFIILFVNIYIKSFTPRAFYIYKNFLY